MLEPYLPLERVLPDFLLGQVGCRQVVVGSVVLERVVAAPQRRLHQPVTMVTFVLFHTEAVMLGRETKKYIKYKKSF